MATDHEVVIERGKKIPRKRKTCNKYPWDRLLPGESFSVPLGDKPDTIIRRVRQGVTYANTNKYPKRFTTRVLQEEGVIRCWRKT